MVLMLRCLLVKIIIIITLTRPALSSNCSEHRIENEYRHLIPDYEPKDWRTIEYLAEEHPYIVALLTVKRDYLCTGSVINRKCVLTSGNCVVDDPRFVANLAAYNKQMRNHLFIVDSAVAHPDYTYDTRMSNMTRIHSNLGLVFVKTPFLKLYINVAPTGNFFASELRQKKLLMIGYGTIDESNTVALQSQSYQQTECSNPKWYYCVCGKIKMDYTTFFSEFGSGSPVLFGSLLVGLSTTPNGTMDVDNPESNENVFTVVGPYFPWIKKITGENYSTDVTFRSNSAVIHQNAMLKHFHILIIISIMFF